MKKIFSLIFLTMFFFASIAHAEKLVRISDYTVNEFYSAYNYFAVNIVGNNYTAKNLF